MNREERDNLIVQYLFGEPGVGEIAALDAELRSDPDAGLRVAELSFQESLLIEAGEEGRLVEQATAPESEDGTIVRFSIWRVVAALAACLVLMFGAAAAYRHLAGQIVPSGYVVGANVQPGDVIGAGKGETVTIAYCSEKSWLQLREQSRVKIDGNLEQKQVNLLAGSVLARAVPQSSGRSFCIRTPHATMTAVGTIFSATLTPESTRLHVQDGIVLFSPTAGGPGERIGRDRVAIIRSGAVRVSVPGQILARHTVPELKLGGYGLSGIAIDGNDVLAFMGNGVNGNMTPAICRIDGRTGKPLKIVEAPEMRMGSGYGAAAWDGKYFWGAISNNIPAAVDLETGKVVRRLTVTGKKDGSPLNWLAFDADPDSLWVLGGWKGDEIYRVNSATGEVISMLKIKMPAWGVGRLAKRGNILILGETRGRRMCAVDLATSVIVSEHTLAEPLSNGDLAAGNDGNIWVSEWTRNSLSLVEGE